MTSFSIITPSFQSAPWLPLALASVADQKGKPDFIVEHIVQDACSDDGTAEILKQHPKVRAFIEADDGMYDAINRGLRKAGGDILAYLNCDEQYLPGTLEKVAEYFAQNLEVDVLFGGMVVTNAEGNYICSRKVLSPLAIHTRVCHLSTFSCGMFFRRRVIEEGHFFDSKWKMVGDADWVLRGLGKGLTMRAIPDLLAAFADTGDNLGNTTASLKERNLLRAAGPSWQIILTPLVAAQHRLRRLLRGVYWQKPFNYAIYTRSSSDCRTTFTVSHPRTLWENRFTLLR